MARLLIYFTLCLSMTLHLGCSSASSDGDDEIANSTDGMEDEGGQSAAENSTDEEDIAEEVGDEPANKKEAVKKDEGEDFEDEFVEDKPAPKEEKIKEEDLAEAEEPPPKAEKAPPPPVRDESVGLSEESGPPMVVTNIDFLSNQSGGSIAIKTSAPAQFKTRYNDKTNQFVVELQNTTISSAMKRPYIMKDFETSFGAINAYQTPGSMVARVVIQMKGPGEPVAQQEGNSLLVLPGAATPVGTMANQDSKKEESWDENGSTNSNVRSEGALSARTLDEFLTGSGRFYGKPLSIQTNDADIRDVIGFIAEESGVNLVIGDDVDGKVSLKLRQVPWDQALVIVMKAKGLGYVRQGSVIRITKLSTLQSEATMAKSIVDAQKTLSPLRVKVMPISYAVVVDLEKQIAPFLTESRGKVISDARTSSLIVTDTAEILEKVERLVKELDIPPAQVMIEGKVVEATEAFNRTLGVNWGWSGTATQLSSGGGLNGSPLNLTLAGKSTSLAVDQISSANGFLNLRIGAFDFFGDLNAQLSLAQAESLVRIISSPRIVAMNKQQAEISQEGEVITIKNTTVPGSSNTTSEANRTAVKLRLTVTPQVTNEGSVLLDVDVLRQFAGPQADAATKARPINSRAAKTKVLVPNGQTAVIGGIYQNDEQVFEGGIPGLKDIPIFGWLFKSKTESREKNELIIFLTPRILNAKDQAVSTTR